MSGEQSRLVRHGEETPSPGDIYGRLIILHEQTGIAAILVVILLVDVAVLVVALKILSGVTTSIIVPGVNAGGVAIPSYF